MFNEICIYEAKIDKQDRELADLRAQLAKYARPRGEGGKFTTGQKRVADPIRHNA